MSEMSFDILFGPEPSSIEFFTRMDITVVNGLIDKHQFFLAIRLKYILTDALSLEILDAEFLLRFATERLLHVFTKIHMSANRGVPLARLDIFPVGPALQEMLSLAVEDMKMHYGMKQFAAIMTFTASGSVNHITQFIYDGKQFLLIIFHHQYVFYGISRDESP